jgi:hypothetical protein
MPAKSNRRHGYGKRTDNTRRRRRPQENKFQSPWCNNAMTFHECELAILRHAVDLSDERKGSRVAQSEEVRKIIRIVESFISKKKLVCYGGTAINNILPEDAQFYNREVEIPDYDFFSKRALEDAKELADIYYRAGYAQVEAKTGVHHGTYKVFVNFIGVADITQMHEDLFQSIQKEAISRDGILYAPPNYLRMSMFLELSRPEGDTSRWEKVLKRMTLLNEHYPLTVNGGKEKCETIDFQRKMSTHAKDTEKIYYTVRDSFIAQGVVFFGGYASSLYTRYMPKERKHIVRQIPDFDVLAENPEECAEEVKTQLKANGFHKIKLVHHTSLDEVIPDHVEILVGGETLAFVYRPLGCHNYNTIEIDGEKVNVATIDTMLSFYLAFAYANKPYFDKTRILCMSMFLFDVEQRNRLQQKGLLKRFTLKCYGKQTTLDDMRAEKVSLYEKMKNRPNSKEFEERFLKYLPAKNPKIKAVAKKTITKTAPRRAVTLKKSYVITPTTKPVDASSSSSSSSEEDDEDTANEEDQENESVQDQDQDQDKSSWWFQKSSPTPTKSNGVSVREWFRNQRKRNGFIL